MKPFEFVDHTADIKIVARGKTLEKAFENTAIATFEVMTDTSKIKEKLEEVITIQAKKVDTLLYDFIDELIFLMDTKAFLLKKFQNTKIIQSKKGYTLHTTSIGDIQENTKQYDVTSYIKSPTYNDMSITKKERYYEIIFVPDI